LPRPVTHLLMALLVIPCLHLSAEASCIGLTCCLEPWLGDTPARIAWGEVVADLGEGVRVRLLGDTAYCEGGVECPLADFPTDLLWCPERGCSFEGNSCNDIHLGSQALWVVEAETGCAFMAIHVEDGQAECAVAGVPPGFAMAHALRPWQECRYYYQMAGFDDGDCGGDCDDSVAGQRGGIWLGLVIGLWWLVLRFKGRA